MPKTHTEKAILQEPAILDLDWSERLVSCKAALQKKASRLAFIGTGTSYHAALWAHWLCGIHGVPSRATTTWDELVVSRHDKNELVVVISQRGNKGLTKDLLKKLGPTPHVIVCAENSPVGAHPYLYTSPQETSNAHTMSLVGAIGACSELVSQALSSSSATNLRRQRKKTAELFDVLLNEAAVPIILDAPRMPLHIVGGGPFHPIALELALKAREMAHAPAHGYGLEEILHGPFTSIEDDDAVILLSPHRAALKGPAKKLYEKRLQACQNAAEAIGCLMLAPRYSAKITRAMAGIDLAWQALVSLSWGQLFFLTHAKHWGFDPDSNRQEDPRYADAKQAVEYK